jgi:hypothetical protein
MTLTAAVAEGEGELRTEHFEGVKLAPITKISHDNQIRIWGTEQQLFNSVLSNLSSTTYPRHKSISLLMFVVQLYQGLLGRNYPQAGDIPDEDISDQASYH